MNQLKAQFLLDPSVVYLNHGSFGATPRPVFAAYQEWQRRLERQPVKFLDREIGGYLAEARQTLASYINAARDDVVYVPNATFALNVVARSLDLGPEDEVLATDHEYGACENVWRFLAQKCGFAYKKQPISLPVGSDEAIIDGFWGGVTSHTKVIFLGHITSSTAMTMPVEDICRLARERGILTIIDGAHAPGQIPIDMETIGADFYFGNAHKWMCSPKGAGFLHTRPEKQHLIEPLVVGWGWGENSTFSYGSQYLDYLQWLGTNDLAAYLSVPEAIEFQEENNWPAVRQNCHSLLEEALGRINGLTGMEPVYPDGDDGYQQMAIASIPVQADRKVFQRRLYDGWHIEVPITEWRDRHFIRVSIQGYNTSADVDVLLEALASCLPG